MANAIAKSRTNYFRVKDLDAFKADLAAYGISTNGWDQAGYADIVLDDGPDNTPKESIALFVEGVWPSFDEDFVADRLELEEGQTPPQKYAAIEDLIAAHLINTDVAVITGVNSEKMRWIDGYSVAVNARGEKRSLRLDDIYDIANQIATEGTPVTLANY